MYIRHNTTLNSTLICSLGLCMHIFILKWRYGTPRFMDRYHYMTGYQCSSTRQWLLGDIPYCLQFSNLQQLWMIVVLKLHLFLYWSLEIFEWSFIWNRFLIRLKILRLKILNVQKPEEEKWIEFSKYEIVNEHLNECSTVLNRAQNMILHWTVSLNNVL